MKDFRYLKKGKIPISLDNAKKRYSHCKVCKSAKINLNKNERIQWQEKTE